MAQVISANAQFMGRGQVVKRQRFLSQAHGLLFQARREAAAGDWPQALEFAYQAGLRTAGAWVADSPVAKRKRLPSSAWDRLALVGAEAKGWAQRFRAYGTTRSRVMSGLDDCVEAQLVLELIALAGDFLARVDGTDTLEFAGAA
ncbi:hypothetical protein G7Y31_08075 [Corynebacterium lizhenjunii]|uniref:SAV-6107-like HEPN domain-containing protein n=1 Tax=Corynebacterium lizhenjunii TaxID=2709394 RepID=A0A7T0KF21_9CORY|nr:SAV_6107 family HEPN domain-containing protein [Corynebacterium lizhenjunii]QPK78513.1 hypothetical protein G7Y31_08075 [Corynebacterium lizhenjunii]